MATVYTPIRMSKNIRERIDEDVDNGVYEDLSKAVNSILAKKYRRKVEQRTRAKNKKQN